MIKKGRYTQPEAQGGSKYTCRYESAAKRRWYSSVRYNRALEWTISTSIICIAWIEYGLNTMFINQQLCYIKVTRQQNYDLEFGRVSVDITLCFR